MADKELATLADIDALADADSIPVRDATDTAELKEATLSQVDTYISTATATVAAFASAAQGATADTALQNVVEDTTPQLGGNLDLNGNVITGLEIGTDVQAYAAALDAVSGTNTGDEAAASLTVSGVVELATIAETDTGTDATRAVTPAGLAGSALQTKVDGIETAADVTDAVNVAAAGAPIISSGAGAPGSTPSAVGDIYIDTTGDIGYVAAGTASSADWKQATGAGGGDLLAANNLSDVANAATSLTNLGVTAAAQTVVDDATVDAMLNTLGGATATGTGGVVRATSPTLVTPALGTPSALVGTNITGTAAGLTVGATTGVEAGADVTDATNVAAAGAHMSGGTDVPVADGGTGASTASAALTNLGVTAAAQTVLDDATVSAMVDTLGGASATGTGGIVRATSPTLVTPALGTPASGVATNLTGTAAGLTAGLVTAAGAATFTDTNGIITATTIDGALQEVFQGAHDVAVNGTTGATETLAVEPSHKMTMDQACAFTFMTPPTLGYTFVLHLLGAFTPTLPASVDWDSGAAPTYVGTGNGSLFVFTTTDTGTTWMGTMVGSAFA